MAVRRAMNASSTGCRPATISSSSPSRSEDGGVAGETPRPGLPGVLGSEGAAIAASGRPRPEVGAALLIGRSIERRPVELGARARFFRTRSLLVRRVLAWGFPGRSFVCGLREVGLVERRLFRNRLVGPSIFGLDEPGAGFAGRSGRLSPKPRPWRSRSKPGRSGRKPAPRSGRKPGRSGRKPPARKPPARWPPGRGPASGPGPPGRGVQGREPPEGPLGRGPPCRKPPGRKPPGLGPSDRNRRGGELRPPGGRTGDHPRNRLLDPALHRAAGRSVRVRRGADTKAAGRLKAALRAGLPRAAGHRAEDRGAVRRNAGRRGEDRARSAVMRAAGRGPPSPPRPVRLAEARMIGVPRTAGLRRAVLRSRGARRADPAAGPRTRGVRRRVARTTGLRRAAPGCATSPAAVHPGAAPRDEARNHAARSHAVPRTTAWRRPAAGPGAVPPAGGPRTAAYPAADPCRQASRRPNAGPLACVDDPARCDALTLCAPVARDCRSGYSARRQRWPSRVSSTRMPLSARTVRRRSEAAQSRPARAAARSSSSLEFGVQGSVLAVGAIARTRSRSRTNAAARPASAVESRLASMRRLSSRTSSKSAASAGEMLRSSSSDRLEGRAGALQQHRQRRVVRAVGAVRGQRRQQRVQSIDRRARRLERFVAERERHAVVGGNAGPAAGPARRRRGPTRRRRRRCCPSTWPSSGRPSGGGRSGASRPRTVWPVAASLCAISSWWCGKTRSTPPVWMSKRRPEVGHAHGRALDVPARPARSDGRVPARLVGLGAFPEREVADVVLAVLVRLDALADPHAVRIEASQPAVGGPRGDPEEDRAVVGAVGVAAARAACSISSTICGMCSVALGMTSGIVMPSVSTSAEELEPVSLRELPDRDALGPGASDDLVVDVGDVHHPRHLEAAVTQVADQQVGEQERAEVADVGRAVDGRTAAVDPDVARLERDELARRAGHRVEQPDRHAFSLRRRVRGREPDDGAGRDRPARAFGTFQVAGRGLDVDRVRASMSRIVRRSRPAISGSRPASRGRAATIVMSRFTGPPARGPDSSTTLPSMIAAVDAGGRAGVGREEPAQVAQAGGAEQRVGDRVQSDVPVRMTGQPRRAFDRQAAEHQRARRARTDGCPCRSRPSAERRVAGRRRPGRPAPGIEHRRSSMPGRGRGRRARSP